MVAGIVTDLIQGAIMVIGSVLVFFIALDVTGGFTEMSQQIDRTHEPQFLNTRTLKRNQIPLDENPNQ